MAAALLVAALGATGCRAAPRLEAAGTSVNTGETIHGRVHCANEDCQCFTFEGVESSLLDFSLVSDDASIAAPLPTISDPEGAPLDISPHVASPDGAATMRVHGIALRRTGIYRVTVNNQVPGHPIFYRFHHDLRFPPIEDLRLRLSPQEPSRVYVAAPRGGVVTVRVKPLDPKATVPDLHGVVDPWGGRALDAAQTPAGRSVPMASRLADGTLVLQFTAPRPGVYTVLAATRGTCPGDAAIYADVAQPNCGGRVWHTDAPCSGYGVPGGGPTAGVAPAALCPPERAIAAR